LSYARRRWPSTQTERREATKAEILAAAWDLVREQGLGGLNLRDLAPRVGMRAPSLYEYFASKHAIYDAMFAQGYRQFAAAMAEVDALSDEDGLRSVARRSLAFMVEEPARYQLLSHRTIPRVHAQPAVLRGVGPGARGRPCVVRP